MPELDVQVQETVNEPEDPDFHNRNKDGYNTNVIQCLVGGVGILLFFVPIIAAAADYLTDITMFTLMDEKLSDFKNDVQAIRSSRASDNLNNLLICYPTNDAQYSDDLYDFLQYTINIYPNDTSNYNPNRRNCTCNSLHSSSDPNASYTASDYESDYCDGSDGKSNIIDSYTTINIDSECEAATTTYSASTIMDCQECDCGNISTFDTDSPQFGYGYYLYSSNSDVYKSSSYCSPSKANKRLNKGRRNQLEVNLINVRNTNAAFLILSAIWLICYLLLAGIILFREFCRFMCYFCYKRDRPPINYDEITWLVFVLVMLHIFEDLPQLIVSTIFSVYYLEDGGAECISNWRGQDFKTYVGPIPRTDVSNFFDGLFWNSTVQLFFLTSFFHVFVHGVYAISLVEFRFTKMFENKWQKNAFYILFAFLLGFLALWLMLVPFWYVVWANAQFFGFTGGWDLALAIFVAAGGVGWLGICMMWLVACLCCADGGDGGCDVCG